MDGTAKARRPFLLLLGIVLSGSVVLLFFFINKEVPQRLIVLQRPFSPPLSIRERLDRNTLTRWQWVQALENLILGSPKTISCAVFQLGQQDAMPFEEIVGTVSAEDVTNGLQVWFLPAVSLNGLRTRIAADAHNKVYRQTTTTPAGTRAALGLMEQAVITNGVASVPGLELLFLPRRSSQTTDLFANVVAFTVVTEDSKQGGGRIGYTRTNVDIAVRLQIPKGKGVLLLQGKPGNNKEYQTGFILDPL
jgi:hypothetical protein